IEQHTQWWVTVLARDEPAAANPAKP
ncbi:regulatory protein, partial [Pseudomonas syringae pv. actinidiae ICMP 18804]